MSTLSGSSDRFEGTDRFELRRLLGEGGFGKVYEAYDQKRNAPVALKVLKKVDPASLYRFKQEFRAMADISHRNLVMLYELISEAEEWFFTMEYIEGKDFLEYVRPDLPRKARGATAPSPFHSSVTIDGWDEIPASEDHETLDIADRNGERGETLRLAPGRIGPPPDMDALREAFLQLTDAVCALHEADILHRDIKPPNLLVDGAGRVVVLDFGLSASLDLPDPEGSAIYGTPLYMAPEQMVGGAVSRATDWFSVGVILYQTLTGRLPFGGSIGQILQAKKTRSIRRPDGVVSGLPPDLTELCWALLSPDPAQRPSEFDVIRRLRGPRARPRESFQEPRATVLVGRDHQMHLLREAWEKSRTGKPVVATIHGLSGMGKTALARTFLRTISETERDAIVLRGRCYERESVPYKALDSVVDTLTQVLKSMDRFEVDRIIPPDIGALTRLFPVLDELDSPYTPWPRPNIFDAQELRRRAFAAFCQLFRGLTISYPVVMFIDDLHWGDLDSATLVAELLRMPDPPALLLIVSYRSDERESSPVLQEFLPLWSSEVPPLAFQEIEIGELSSGDARQLARRMIDPQRQETLKVDSLVNECGGNPFFLTEVVRSVATATETEVSWSGSLDDVILGRVEQLPPESQRLLEFIAVAAQPIELQTAQRAAELEAEEHPASEFLRAARLVRVRETRTQKLIETYHDRIRVAVVGALSETNLRDRHLRLARTWEASNRFDPETLAGHFEQGGELDRAAGYTLQAADQAAAALAFDRASRLYRRALELGTFDASEEEELRAKLERTLRVKLADALANDGHGADAAAEYLRAAEGASSADAIEFRRRAAENLLFTGHISDGLEVLQEVLDMVKLKPAPTPRRALVNIVVNRMRLALTGFRFHERAAEDIPAEQLIRVDTCWSASYSIGMVSSIRGGDFQVRHMLLALKAGEPYRVARAMALEVGFSGGMGPRAEMRAEPVKQKAIELARRVGNPHALGLVELQIGTQAHMGGRYRESIEYFERAERIFRDQCTGVAWEINVAQLFWLHSQWWTGSWTTMAERMKAVLSESLERGNLFMATYIRTRLAYQTYLSANEPEKAAEEQARALSGWSQKDFDTPHYWDCFSSCEIDLYSGNPEAAGKRLAEKWSAIGYSMVRRLSAFRAESDFLRARIALALAATDSKNSPRFLKSARRLVRKMEREKILAIHPFAHLIRAGIQASVGDKSGALAVAQSAQTGFERHEMKQFAAATRRRRGELIGGHEGGELIAAADAWMRSEGVLDPEAMTRLLAPGDWV